MRDNEKSNNNLNEAAEMFEDMKLNTKQTQQKMSALNRFINLHKAISDLSERLPGSAITVQHHVAVRPTFTL